MDITDFLVDIATGYDRAAGVSTPTQRLLARASQHLAQHVPGGIVIKGSGGKSTATLTPWVGFFDPDETLSPQEGVYVVYIFTEDLQSVILSLQQGMENLVKTLGPGKARIRLAADAVAIRESLPPSALMGLDATIHLGSKGFRQRGYEAGSIAAIRYDVSALPSEHDLGRDLRRILNLYQLVVATKRSLLQAQPGSIASPSILQEPGGDPLKDFKPKSSEDYVTHLTGRTLSKSRRHEQ